MACGLQAEARIAAREPGTVCVVESTGELLNESLRHQIAAGACGLISFGIAGGLAPGLAPGTWVVARSVVTGTARWDADPAWVEALLARLPGAWLIDLAGSDEIVARPEDKLALRQRLGASAVDMESHRVAAAALRSGLPFAVFRVVADPAERRLPPAACLPIGNGGRIRIAAVCASLFGDPRQIPALAGVAVDAWHATRALSRGRRRLGAGLACPDFDQLMFDMS